MFLGEYQLKFTSPGRVILPKKIRSELSGEVIILSRGFEECIWGFDKKEWEEMAKKQLEISATEERARYLRRYLYSASVDVELDAQGRFIIPTTLLSYAKVGRELVMIGAGDHFEIWNKRKWAEQLAGLEKIYGRLS